MNQTRPEVHLVGNMLCFCVIMVSLLYKENIIKILSRIDYKAYKINGVVIYFVLIRNKKYIMKRKLPPMNGLRAFEATARHLSFTAAANELNVTPAAVGHQVRALEDYFGQKLLDRNTRKVELTEVARWVLPVITQGLDLLAEAGDRLMAPKASPIINLSVEPDFASRWLVQRLESFHLHSPEWEVRLATNNELADLSKQSFDMGIRYGSGEYAGLRAHKLGQQEVFPVCSPTLLQGDKAVHQPDDLRWHTLLHEDWAMSEDQIWPSWKMWLKAVGASKVNPDPGTHFSTSALALQAAITGQGVALASTALVTDDLKAGRLVRPFGEQFSTRLEMAYHLVYLEETENDPKIIAFRDWLLEEYNQSVSQSRLVRIYRCITPHTPNPRVSVRNHHDNRAPG